MANLTSLSQLESERGRAALGVLLLEAPLTRHLDQQSGFEEDATDFDWRPASASATLGGRGIGEGYTATAQVPEYKVVDSLAMVGDALTIDITHLADAQRNLRDIQAYIDKWLPRKVKAWARAFDVGLWTSSAADLIPGLDTIVDGATDLPGFTGVKAVLKASAAAYANDVSLDVTNKDNWPTLIRLLQDAMAQVPQCSGLHMNRRMYGLMQGVATDYHIRGEARDQFGRPVTAFDGIPMIPHLDGAIADNEPDATPTTPLTNTTSIWVSRFGEGSASLVTNSGFYWKDYEVLEATQNGQFVWEIRGKWKIEDSDAIRRVMHLKT